MAATGGSDTFPSSFFLSHAVSSSSAPIFPTSGVKTNAETSPRAGQGDWSQIAVKMEMPIKLTARLRLSFRFTL